MPRILKIFLFLFSTMLFLAIVGAGGGVYLMWEYGKTLPEHKQLAKYDPPTVTRVHAGDGRLIAEYALERRVFVPVAAMPRHLINAFIAAEDQNFYHHPGVDVVALARAAVTNAMNIVFRRTRRPVGASTITQQVAKNFLLSNELSIERKVKEAILALRIERAFSKQRILELYLNEIYLGYGSYGVAAAALNYFNKSLDELTVSEAAYLAALPKAPNNYHPIRKQEAAITRRNWVVGRMLEEGYIDTEGARVAMEEPLGVVPRTATQIVRADYFLEEIRRELVARFEEKGLYEGGLSVRTTLNPRLQGFAASALRGGLIEYDRRHGWRGPVGRIEVDANWAGYLSSVKAPAGSGNWQLAAVLDVSAKEADLGFADGTKGTIPLAELLWARAWKEDQKVGPKVRRASDVLRRGDVVLVEPVAAEPAKGADKIEGKEPAKPAAPTVFALRQVPTVSGAILAIDPHTGRVLAMSGGYDYEMSEFNRATQGRRQPGSAFKPFVYLTALSQGFSPAINILDAPIVIEQGPGEAKWKPDNYSRKFYGESPMRLGIEKSRNLMTVRLAQAVGMKPIIDTAKRFGIVDDMPRDLTMALGAGETTLLRLTTAYSMVVNGGKRITPALIDRVQDRTGKTIFRHDTRPCEGCAGVEWRKQEPPAPPDTRERIADPIAAYQIVSMLEGVIKRGTGRRVLSVGKPLAGKTGTTNESRDAWFMGFSPNLAVGVYAGFDQPRTLGKRETGSSVAAPIFKKFMENALAGRPVAPFRIPPGIRHVRIDPKTGKVAGPDAKVVILEAFRAGTEPEPGAEPRLLGDRGDKGGGGGSEAAAPAPRGLY